LKLKLFEITHTLKPKDKKGRLVAPAYVFDVRPKPRGVILNLNKYDRVLKNDRMVGVIIQKEKNTKILKQWD